MTALSMHPVTRKLFDEPTPRSDDNVERISADAVARTRRTARLAGFGITMFALVVLAGLGALMISTAGPDVDASFAFWFAVVLLLCIWLIPYWAIRRLILRDARAIVRLAREGTAYRQTSVNVGRFLDGSISLRVGWLENNREVSGEFELRRQRIDRFDPADIFVVARPRDQLVLVVLGPNGVFVGKRRGLFGTLN